MLKYNNVIIKYKERTRFFLAVNKCQQVQPFTNRGTRDKLPEGLTVYQDLCEFQISQNIYCENISKVT
jgi:hypothetical protein